jgi:hypothetical protein
MTNGINLKLKEFILNLGQLSECKIANNKLSQEEVSEIENIMKNKKDE